MTKQPFKSINKYLHPNQTFGWWVRFPQYDHASKRDKSKIDEEENAQPNNRRRRKYIIHHNWNKYSDKKTSEVNSEMNDTPEVIKNREESEKQQEKEEIISSEANEEGVIESKGVDCEDVLLLFTPNHREQKEKKLSCSKYMILAKGNYFSKVFLTEEEVAKTSLYSYQELHEKIKELFLESNKAILIAELVSYKDLKEIDMLSAFGFDDISYASNDCHSIYYFEISRGWVVRNDWKSNVNL